MVSIIIRTKNEERWIGHCLKQIKIQSYIDYEVILVDNQSDDYTIQKAKLVMPDIKIHHIEEFMPGKALNLGIINSSGEYIVCLSAHCIPVNEYWLEKLVNEIKSDENIAGVYGRQLPMDQTHDIDRRDMYVTFGLDRRVQYKDPFFHNANSILRKDLWEKTPFDENERNIEDRVWAQKMIDNSYKIIYTPDSMVYHYHGIHQTNKNTRYKNIVKIIERTNNKLDTLPISEYNIQAIIPILNVDLEDEISREVFINTIKLFSSISIISNIVITTDNLFKLKKMLPQENNLILIERENIHTRVVDVYAETIKSLKTKNEYPDIVVMSDISYPFKSRTIIENCIYELLKNDVDAVIPAYAEMRPTWIKDKDGEYKRVDNYEVSKKEREPTYIGLENISTVAYSDKVKNHQNFFNNKIEMVIVDNPYYKLKLKEIKSRDEFYYIMKNINKQYVD